jgi:hypothetical protein
MLRVRTAGLVVLTAEGKQRAFQSMTYWNIESGEGAPHSATWRAGEV